jgi:two-component system CitB family sensor kinase
VSRLSPTRLTLSRQLLLLQMCIVVLVVTTVAGVSAVQTDQAFRRDESRRMLGTAESVATEGLVRAVSTTEKARSAGDQKVLEDAVKIRLERARVSAGADFAVLVKRGGRVLSESIPDRTDDAARLEGAVVDGATWSGTSTRYDRRTIEAQVPVFSARIGKPSRLLGYLILGRFYPSRLEVLGTAAPSVFLYLALAGAIGVAGSLLLARRVKRQTLGLEPGEIAALVEQREAMLHGVREGVLGVDLLGAVAFVNDEAMRLLGLRDPVLGKLVEELGQQTEVAGVLAGRVNEKDVVVAVGGRLLVLNNQPIRVRNRQTGWVTSMRDRTELLGVQQELADAQAGTDTLRAQVHEFRNRLHAISGMAELGQTDDLQAFVQTVMTDLDSRLGEVSQHVEDPAVAALVVAKASRADELGIRFSLAEGAHLGQHAAQLSADLVTVVGNLVDNAFDAVGGASGSVVLDFEDDGERIEVEVRDSGAGIPADTVERAFQVGWTTKSGSDAKGHGFGLALTRMACQRHHGTVRVGHRGGAVLSAELFVNGSADG